MRTLLTPAADLGNGSFGGDAPRLLLAGNAGHADIPLDAPGSGLMAMLMSMLGQTVGFPVPEGGAGGLAEALARRLRARGGEIRCDAEVSEIVVRAGRPRGRAPRRGPGSAPGGPWSPAVAAPVLYGGCSRPRTSRLRPGRACSASSSTRPRSRSTGRSTARCRGRGPRPYPPGTVHVADSVADATEALGQVAAGLVPARPFLLAGQMTTTDPTRSPAGTESMWAYTHVPQHATDDAGDGGIRGVWDARRPRAVRRPDAGTGSRCSRPASAPAS